jgi:hypothetical protein
MKRLASVCGVVAALTIVGTAVGQDGEKRTIKHLMLFLIDATTKGISEQTETKGTGIKQIEIQEGAIAKKTLLDAKYTTGEIVDGANREWVVKSVKTTLVDNTVVEGQVLLMKEIGKATLQNVRNAGASFVSHQGARTWYVFYAEYDVAADSSKENIAQAKKDMEGLQGTWRPEELIKVVVKGDKMTRYDSRPGQEETLTGTLNIDPKTKAFDWTGRFGIGIHVHTMMGIYEVKGDDLKIYFGDELERAKTFDAKGGRLWVFKREKP